MNKNMTPTRHTTRSVSASLDLAPDPANAGYKVPKQKLVPPLLPSPRCSPVVSKGSVGTVWARTAASCYRSPPMVLPAVRTPTESDKAPFGRRGMRVRGVRAAVGSLRCFSRTLLEALPLRFSGAFSLATTLRPQATLAFRLSAGNDPRGDIEAEPLGARNVASLGQPICAAVAAPPAGKTPPAQIGCPNVATGDHARPCTVATLGIILLRHVFLLASYAVRLRCQT